MLEATQQTGKEVAAQKRGWSGKNIFLGLGLLFVGFVIWFGDSVVEGFAQGVAGNKTFSIGFWGRFGFAVMAVGVLGYWIAIPAAQKWWYAKRWLAWTFLAPCLLLGMTILIALLFRR